MSAKKNAAMQRAAKNVGGVSHLARLCHVSRQAIHQWLISGCPPTRALQVEKLTGVPREELRPDLYPRERAGA